MAVKHVYVERTNGQGDVSLFGMSTWGSCWAALQLQNNNAVPRIETCGPLHVFWGFAQEFRGIIELLMESDFWKRLTNCDMELLPEGDIRAANDMAWADHWGTPVSTDNLFHFKLNGHANAPGIITGFRMLSSLSYIPRGAQRDAITTPDEAAIALIWCVARDGSNFFSDGCPGMYTPTGEDFHTYVEEFGKVSRDDLYYEKLVSWASVRQGCSYYDDYGIADKSSSHDAGDLYERQVFINPDQVAEVFLRTSEEMRSLERGHGPLLTTGYLKDYEFLNNDEDEIPNDPNFPFTINGAISVKIDYTQKTTLAPFSQDALAQVKALVNIN